MQALRGLTSGRIGPAFEADTDGVAELEARALLALDDLTPLERRAIRTLVNVYAELDRQRDMRALGVA